MRYLIKFSYDGSKFYGYQKQPKLRTVEGEFENALYSINNKQKTRIYSSGRTDSGVHAIGQCAHFDLNINITEYKIKCALNSLLPNDIHVFFAKKVKADFNSRFNAKEKEYYYLINVGEYNPISRNYIYQYNKKLNIKIMRSAIKYFKGKHDFRAFVSEESKKNNYIRYIKKAKIKTYKDIIKISFVGNGFMKYQIRNMVGTLIRIGNDKLKKDSIKKILSGELDNRTVFTAPSEGLYLKRVKYSRRDLIEKKI
ncbi:MAG: tRNA pseudouridine(38-40) synthase TruA [bacterium]|nr:tRNA pseudouridine(38-40) synthase TruA [bacterium]